MQTTTTTTTAKAANAVVPAQGVMAGRLRGKTAVVTGGTSGIGGEIARQLAAEGATVVVVGRNAEKGRAFAEALRGKTGNAAIHFMEADLLSQASVRALATSLLRRFERLDILVNNAGGAFFKRGVTADGIEKTLALNVLTPYLLTNLLAPALQRSGSGRVINVATKLRAGEQLRFDDLQSERGYGAISVYGRAKLALMMLTAELSRRLSPSGIRVNSYHPGVVPETDFGTDMPRIFRVLGPFVAKMIGVKVSLEQAADTALYLAAEPEVAFETGKYFIRRELAAPPLQARDAEAARRLWDACAALTGTSAPAHLN